MRINEMLGDYLEEARNTCQAIEAASYEIGKDPMLIREVMRLLHTLKGSSGFMGFDAITELCHIAEDRLSSMKEIPGGFPRFLRALSATLSVVFDEIEETGAELPSCKDRIKPLVDALLAGDYSEYIETEGLTETPGIRITPEKLDRIMTFLGEVEVIKNRLSRETARLPRDIARAFHDLELNMAALRDEVMTLRMVNMGRYLKKLGVLVQEMASDLGKKVELITRGADIDVDKAVADGVMDAMVHLLRNAIDHGIEPPEERKRVGKPLVGQILVEITQQGNRVRITISDDGAGVNMESLRQKARELYGTGMEMDDKELLAL
ncbi:MAG: Hpt domain-containing protein, partial [Candidatus Hydrothermia bacterium]